jgi:hypothetical protein
MQVIEHMTIHMRPEMWPLGVSLIREQAIPIEYARLFIREAIRVVETKDVIAFLMDHDHLLDADMIHSLAPTLCPYFTANPEALDTLYLFRQSAILVEELLLWFRRAYNPEAAARLLRFIDFDVFAAPPVHLRFFALKLPVLCIERTPFFRRDGEVIALALQCRDVYALSAAFVSNLDTYHVAHDLFDSLVELDGAWGALSFLANRFLARKRVGTTLRAKLFHFLFDDPHLHTLYKHADGGVYLHRRDRAPLLLSSSHWLPRVDIPEEDGATANVHPFDLWGCFRTTHTSAFVARCPDKILATATNHLPPRVEFYARPFYDAQRHAALFQKTVLALLNILGGFQGVHIVPLLDRDGQPVLYPDLTPVLLLAGEADFEGINRAVEREMGISLPAVFAADRFEFGRQWVWFGFFVHPLLRRLAPTDRLPHHVVQVSCHVQLPIADAPQSSRFSPWLVYDPHNTAPVGPRLMRLHGIEHSSILSVFGYVAVSSGNQLLVALQHFLNTRSAHRIHHAPELFWARALTAYRSLEVDRAFRPPDHPEPAFLAQKSEKRGTDLVLVCFTSPVQSSAPSGTPPTLRKIDLARLRLLPVEILYKIYRMLWVSDPHTPSIRHVVPDVWWTSAKQRLHYSAPAACPFNSYLFVDTPIHGITDHRGVLHSVYQAEVIAFFCDLSFTVDDWTAPFDTWPADALPKSRTFLLPGRIFLVRFVFVEEKRGYYLTIEPNPRVYRVHATDAGHSFGLFL